MTTYPLTTLAPTVSSSGISIPAYEDIYQSLLASFKLIYGSDLYVAPDSQDGQMIAIFAKALHDSNQAAVAVFQSFSPTYAQGVGLSSNVKINGIARLIASNSTCDVTIVGQVGSTISNGVVQDVSGHRWNLPTTVVIPISGSIVVTATCSDLGAINAAPGELTKIATPTLGWQTVTNVTAASPGAAIETDAQLRARQTVSTSLPSRTVFEGTIGAVANVTGVTHFQGYENDTDITNADGIPSHSIFIVVEGGDAAAIGQAISDHKTPGTGTYGNTTEVIYDVYGIPNVIKFSRPTLTTIKVQLQIHPLAGFLSSFEDQIKQSVAASINSLQIGDDVIINRLYIPANLPGTNEGLTYDVQLIEIGVSGGTLETTNIVIPIDSLAVCDYTTDVTIVIA